MAVSEQTPYIEYTANGIAKSFALEFDCENQDHLIVLVDEVEPVAGTWSLSGGAVVFGTAPTSGKKIIILRNTPFRRDGDFQSYDNSFRPGPVNKGLDKTWWKIQELGVSDWLLGRKIQKFRDDVNLTALEETLEQAKEIRDNTADSVIEVQSNVEQSQTLLTNTTAQANLAQEYANSASTANTLAQQAASDVSDAESNVYSALSAQQVAVNNSLTAIAGGHKAYQTLALAQAAQATLPANTVVEVTNDPTSSNNGTYQWNGTTLTKSAYDPLTQAKADATTKANTAEGNAKKYSSNELSNALTLSRSELILSPLDFISGYLKNTGEVQVLAGFSYSAFKNIGINTEYIIEGSSGVSLGDAGTCFYDIDKNFISGVKTSTLVNGSKLALPANAKYFRTCIKTDSINTFNIRCVSTFLKQVEDGIHEPKIYPYPDEVLNTENRNPNNLTTASASGAKVILQFAKSDFAFFIKSAEILMPANSKADIYLYRVNSLTSITKVSKVASVENALATPASTIFTFKGKGYFIPKGYFLAYESNGGSFLYTTNTAQGTSFVNFYAGVSVFPNIGETITVSSGAAVWASAFYIPIKYTYNTIVYASQAALVSDIYKLQSGQEDINAELLVLQEKVIKKFDQVSVYHDNFKQSALQTNWEDTGSSWQFDFDKGEVKPTAIGGSSYSGGTIRTNTLRLKSTYNANKRSAMMRVSFAANTVLEIATTSQFVTGMRIYRIDFANALLQEFSTNGTTLLASKPITIPLVVGKQFIVRLEVDRLQERFVIMDYITGASETMVKNLTSAGDIQLAQYTLALKAGSPFTMYEFDVSVMNRPKVYIVGDSITAQIASGLNGWAYRFTDLLQGDVVISAQGSTNGFNVPLLIESEAKYIKPDILLWCHGHNGGVTQENLDSVKALCDSYGIKMYVNHVSCSANNNHIPINDLIELNGYKGARFDIATARDSNPYPVDGDPAIRADPNLYTDVSTHPNVAGNQKMIQRLLIDLPELFY